MKKNSLDTVKYSRALRPFGTLVLLALALISAPSLQAAELVTYDMQETGGVAITAPTNTHTDITASDLTVASTDIQQFGKIQLSGDLADDFSAWRPTVLTGTGASGALSAGTYFSLTLTPDSERSITLSNLNFAAVAATTGPSARQIYVFSDKTGFADGNELLAASTVSGTPLIPYNNAAVGQAFSIDLSGNSAFSNITDSVTFRFYIQTPDIYQSIAFDNITVNGTTTNAPLVATLLVNYDMETAGSRSVPSVVNINVAATDLVGTNAANTGTIIKSDDVYASWSPTLGGGSTAADALAAATYFSMTVTPNAGESVAISNLSFTVFAATGGPSARQLYIFSDKTGYADTAELFTASTVAGSPLIPYIDAAAGQEYTVDLSGNSAFANITDSVTFRFYLQTPDAGQSLAFGEITVKGAVGDASSYGVGTITAAMSGSNLLINWTGAAGPTYGIEMTPDLVSGTWTNIQSLTGIDGLMSATNAAADPKAFYRVIIQ